MTTYPIAQAAEQAGLSIDALRYYEQEGLMLAPVSRAQSGHRRFSERDVRWLIFLTKVRNTGMPIRRLREYAGLVRAGKGNEAERLQLLVAHRADVFARLQETQRNLLEIERKIAQYRERIALAENALTACQPEERPSDSFAVAVREGTIDFDQSSDRDGPLVERPNPRPHQGEAKL